MKLRKSTLSDINSIMRIIEQAKEYFKENNIDQWQDNYPNYTTIKNDIDKEESYVLIDDNDILATVALSFNGENNYGVIYDGKWLSNSNYAVIHRVAVDKNHKGKGLSGEIFNTLEKICLDNNVSSIKIDTHKENTSMRRFLEKNGFKYCGVIYLEDKSERIAFEKIL